MPRHLTDVQSSPKDQITHAAEVIGDSEHRKRVFVAIYEGKQKIKTATEVVRRSRLPRIRVLQEAGVLAGNDIVHKTKVQKELAYEKDEFYSQNKEKVLRLAGNREALDKFPTRLNPRHEVSIRITLPKNMVKVKEVTIDDIDSFAKVRDVKLPDTSAMPLGEKQFKHGLQKSSKNPVSFKIGAVNQMTSFRHELYSMAEGSVLLSA